MTLFLNTLWKRLGISVFGLLAGVAVLASIVTTDGERAHSAHFSFDAAYPALGTNLLTGLQLVTAKQRANPAFEADGPAWAAEPGTHGPNSPIPSTIRRLSPTEPSIMSWIAKSGEGGICVLASPNHRVHGVYAVSGSCTHHPRSLCPYGRRRIR